MKNSYQLIFGVLAETISTDSFSGSGKSRPCLPREKGLLPEGGSYPNKFLWIIFGGSGLVKVG